MVDYESIIGLEVHAQLNTRSKMFCSCASDYQNASPNTRVCPVCLGLPGALPVINRRAVESVIMTGLALHCRVSDITKFDRKNYPYPDLMKGYQISQYDLPICNEGYLSIRMGDSEKRIGIERVHLEEDVAKLAHRTDSSSNEAYSLLDMNRSGVPLMELVSAPDMRSPEEAKEYLVQLRAILQFLGVSTGNMEEGSFRCDANVSIRPKGSESLFTRVEIKNMNSFRAVTKALQFEIDRQIEMASQGIPLKQETRGWMEERGETFSMRSKEEAHDYRYFPEPDLPPLFLSPSQIQEIANTLPELPETKKWRFINDYSLSEYDAAMLTLSPAIAIFFEQTLTELFDSSLINSTTKETVTKTAANWIITDLNRLLNAANFDIDASPISPILFAELLVLLGEGTLGTTQAKVVLEEMFISGERAESIVTRLELVQVTDKDVLSETVASVIANNEKAVLDYKSGKESAIKFLVGQVMKLSRGKANPSIAGSLIEQQLKQSD